MGLESLTEPTENLAPILAMKRSRAQGLVAELRELVDDLSAEAGTDDGLGAMLREFAAAERACRDHTDRFSEARRENLRCPPYANEDDRAGWRAVCGRRTLALEVLAKYALAKFPEAR